MRLILGSGSPRRREILSYFSLDFEQINSCFDEDAVIFQGDPFAHASILAEGKAISLAALYPEAAILTADTIVYLNGKIYGKPKDEREAFQTLQELEGKCHSVFTSIALWKDGSIWTGGEETKVFFAPLSDTQIQRYLKAHHFADKAGGYAIQLAGSLIVKKIDGCFYNVMGLPIHTANELFKKIGIDLWDHLQ